MVGNKQHNHVYLSISCRDMKYCFKYYLQNNW